MLIMQYSHTIQKRFYTRATLRGIRISRLAKIQSSQPFIVIGWDPWSKDRLNYLSCVEKKVVWKTFTILHQRERDYYSKNLSIFNILSYSDWNLFWYAKYSEHEKLWRQIINPPILKIVLKLGQLIPNLILLLNSKNRRPWHCTKCRAICFSIIKSLFAILMHFTLLHNFV